MRTARLARPGAIYDSAAAAQTFTDGKTIDVLGEREDFSEMGGNGDFQKASKNDCGRIPGFSRSFCRRGERMLTK